MAAPTTVCRWGNVAGAATDGGGRGEKGVQTAWAREGKEEVDGGGRAGVKSILCGLRPREYTDEYTDKHERRRG